MSVSYLPNALFRALVAGALTVSLLPVGRAVAQATTLPSETPAKFTPATSTFDYERRDVMIPMRDGVKLHTVILVPKGAHRAPILLTRTPYDATATTSYAQSAHLAPELNGYDNALQVIIPGGYIRVVQDIRGKYGSEGDYVMNRPLVGPLNPTKVDESTDTYDTIDWLIRHVPETNGNVGELGISYDGFEPLMGLVHPHPALKVSVPMNPMVDGWMGDDWFHNGAFREQNMPYILEQEATPDNSAKWWTDHFDDYDVYMQSGSAGALGKLHGLDQVGFWTKILAHPSYDSWWQQQAMDKILAAQPVSVPVMLVHSLWDQEDIYGAIAVYNAIKPKDTSNDKVFLVIGPWHHGQEIENGSSLGAIDFQANSSDYFQRNILGPFLAHYLKDGAPPMDVSAVNAYETGTNRWERLRAWPSGCDAGCTIRPTPLYLGAGLTASFDAPTAAAPDAAFDSYVSDPAKPVPFRTRPIQPVGYVPPLTWVQWLVDDQREVGGRTDVLSYETGVLTEPVKISGQPVANLVASTTGTDADWVVKLLDVYPDEVGDDPAMGGYELPVSMDIFRGRYRESFSAPKAIAPNEPLLYKFELPTANHVFLPGHRIMVQIQSSWFPLYDRNPQTFVPNIFWAKPGDYKKAEQRVFHEAGHASFVELPIVTGAR
ncbi:MAG TPA: CocE/NonD family hydrolase [Gemmatimonadaceae bacterium]|nr:CocE/NonD family hydrolase [Gemmatimonadaceae bacterium]